MPRYSIRYYETDAGQSPVEDFLNDLLRRKRKAHAKRMAYLDKLQEHGVQLDAHFVEKLKRTSGVWELRPEHQNVEYRFLFGVFDRMFVMVWAGIEKGKLRDRDIDLAQHRIDEIAQQLKK